jgi:hypothetical protein
VRSVIPRVVASDICFKPGEVRRRRLWSSNSHHQTNSTPPRKYRETDTAGRRRRSPTAQEGTAPPTGGTVSGIHGCVCATSAGIVFHSRQFTSAPALLDRPHPLYRLRSFSGLRPLSSSNSHQRLARPAPKPSRPASPPNRPSAGKIQHKPSGFQPIPWLCPPGRAMSPSIPPVIPLYFNRWGIDGVYRGYRGGLLGDMPTGLA